MYQNINIAALERCIVNNENAPGFNLRSWVVDSCGTYGCLFGNDMIATKQVERGKCGDWSIRNGCSDAPSLVFREAAEEYGLSAFATFFVFAIKDFFRGGRFVTWKGSSLVFPDGCRRDGSDLPAALHRLRIAIAYWKRKQAIWHEADGRVRESARHTEGDLNILRSAIEEVARQELAAAV